MTVLEAFFRTLLEDCRQSFIPTAEDLRNKATLKKKLSVSRRAEEERAWLILDWMARGIVFAWLERAGLTEQMEKLRSWPAITRDTAEDIAEKLEEFDRQTLMPIAMAGAAETINSETDQTVDLTRWCGVWTASDFHVNAAVQGTEGASLYGSIVGTASRVVLSAMRLSVRSEGLEAEAGVANTVDRCERSIKPLVERLLAVK